MSDYQFMTSICHAVLDHPVIRDMERTGYPRWLEEDEEGEDEDETL